MTWRDVTIKQFEEVQKASNFGLDETDLTILICQILFPNEYFDLSTPYSKIKKYSIAINNLGDIKDLLSDVESLKEVDIEGVKLVFKTQIEQITTSEYMDLVAFLKNKASIVDILSVICDEKDRDLLEKIDCVTALSLYSHTIDNLGKIHQNFGQLFQPSDPEDDIPSTNRLSKWGILPYVMKVVEITNTKLDEVFDMPICEVFYLTCYQLDVDKLQKEQLEKWKRQH